MMHQMPRINFIATIWLKGLLRRKVGYIPETKIGSTLHFGSPIKSAKDKIDGLGQRKIYLVLYAKEQKPMKKLRNQRLETISSSSTEYNI